jgi:hypothetical protein
MSRGILVINKSDHDLYLPIFHDDREFVYSVLMESMERWKPREAKLHFHESLDFYEIADAIGRERTKSHLFIGPESVPYENQDSIVSHALYVFAVDFLGRKIVVVK